MAAAYTPSSRPRKGALKLHDPPDIRVARCIHLLVFSFSLAFFLFFFLIIIYPPFVVRAKTSSWGIKYLTRRINRRMD